MSVETVKPARLRGPNGHFLPRAAEPVIETPAPAPEPIVEAAPVAVAAVTPVEAPAPAAIPTPAAIVAAPKELKIMATKIEETVKAQTEQFAAQGKAAYEQVQTRAKDAFERGQKTVAELNEFTKGNVEAVIASNKAAIAGFETLAQGATEYAKASAEKTVAVVKTLAASKSVNEFVSTHNDFAKTQFDAAVAEMSKASETFLKVLGEVFEPLSNRLALAADKVAKAGVR